MTKIGFVGLGHMGLPMAINLIKAGHQVTGYDLQASAIAEFTEHGGLTAPNLTTLSKENEVFITMLQTGEQVLGVCQANEGLFSRAKKGSLFIDCSTIDVTSSRNLHQLANTHKLLSVDAPVSGGTAGASSGSLTFMVGGEEKAFYAAKPILESMGKKIIYAGSPGNGQAAKICNNMILGISMIAISEAFILAEQLQLSPQKLYEVVSNSSGECWAITHYAPVAGILEAVPANDAFKPGFAAAMMLKDLHLSQDAAHSVQITTPMGAKATALYQQFIDKGLGAFDFSAIIQLIAQKNEV